MKNFISILISILIFSTNSIAQNLEITSTRIDVKVLIDSLANSINRHYIFPKKGTEISTYLKEQYKKGIYDKIEDPNILAYKLITDIIKINYDSHLTIFYAPEKPKSLQNIKTIEENHKKPQDFEKESNFKFKKVEIFSGNIGYLLFNGFTETVAEAKPTLTAALTFLRNTRSIIIDLRYNGGGSPEMVNQLESYFFRERVHMVDFLTTFDEDTISLYTDPKSTDGLFLAMPIYILTSKNTFSGAEDFTYAMQTTKRAVVVGDTSGGGAHAAIPFPIGQGFMARIPFSRPVNPITLTDWEGVGIIPDIAVPAAHALSKAREVIYQDILAKAKTERDKRIVQWAINELAAETNPPLLPISEIEKYTGTYAGGIRFFLKNGIFLCQNPERGGTDIFKLRPVRKNVFLLDENAQIEFVKDSQGIFSSIKMLWIDGTITEKTRE